MNKLRVNKAKTKQFNKIKPKNVEKNIFHFFSRKYPKINLF